MATLFRKLFRQDLPVSNEKTELPANAASETAWAESKLYKDTVPKYTPDDLVGQKGAHIYDKMMRDEQVKAVVKFKRDAITARDFTFVLESQRAEGLSDTEQHRRSDIYTEMIDNVAGSFTDGLNHIMKAQWQGFSLTEKVYHTFMFENRPYVGLQRLSPKPFDSFDIFVDEYGDIIRIEQHIDADVQTINLDKFVYFVQNPEKDQHYGQSELREAYRSWYSKDVIIRFYNMFMERMASGFFEFKPTQGITYPVGSKEYQSLNAILEHMQATTGVLLPGGVDLTVHQPSTTDQFEKAIEMHDLQIAKALLVPNLLGVTHTGQTGSFSQSETQLEAFLWTLDADALRLEDAINEQLFDPLSRINFADGIGPRFRFKPVSMTKKHEMIKVWLDLVKAGAVEASDTDEIHIRHLMDFPDKGEPLDLGTGELDPMQSAVPQPGAEPRSQRPSDQDFDRGNAGLLRTPHSYSSFTRATKRVAFRVIDRKTAQMTERIAEEVESDIAEMVAGVSLEILEGEFYSKMPHEVQFDSKLKSKFHRTVNAALQEGWDLGTRHARQEITQARGEFKVNMARIGDDAEEFLRSNGYRIVGEMSNDMIQLVAAILASAIKFSWTPEETVRKVYDRLTVDGYIFIETNAEVTGRSVTEIQQALSGERGSLHRVRTMVRTNLFESLNEARYSTFTDPELDGFVEALEYSAILDSRTTAICRHLDDRVYPLDSPEWNEYRPPNHFNCRSILVPVTQIDTEVVGKDREEDQRWSRSPRVEPQRGFGA